MLSGISIFAACWKWYFGSMEGKTSTKKESIHPADRNHSCTTFLWCDSPSYFNAKNTEWKNIYQLRYVLEHEYVHIRRLDMLTKLIMIAAVCIHWFNPLVWVMYILFNRDLELSCDETVVRRFGMDIKSVYATALNIYGRKKERTDTNYVTVSVKMRLKKG